MPLLPVRWSYLAPLIDELGGDLGPDEVRPKGKAPGMAAARSRAVWVSHTPSTSPPALRSPDAGGQRRLGEEVFDEEAQFFGECW